MRTGIITMMFEDNPSDDEIMEMIADFYNDNKRTISGMYFKKLKDKKCLMDCRKAINNVLLVVGEK